MLTLNFASIALVLTLAVMPAAALAADAGAAEFPESDFFADMENELATDLPINQSLSASSGHALFHQQQVPDEYPVPGKARKYCDVE
jgi:hypothetical protein